MILRNARLIPYLTEGYEEERGDVRIENGRIRSIAEPGAIPAGPEEETLDLEGRTLMPGMIDLHMHMCFASGNPAEYSARTQNQCLIDCIQSAQEYLRNGYTTIRDCGNPFYVGIAVRDAIREGIIEGPDVITAGCCVTATASGNESMPALHREVDEASKILGVCRDEQKHGADFIKYMATGSVLNLRGEPGALVTTEEEMQALDRAVNALGTYAAVHCHGTEGIRMCIRNHVRTIEHASFLDDSCIAMLLEEGCETALVPTLSPIVSISESTSEEIPAYLKGKINEVRKCAGMLVKAERAGVLLGWGNDMDFPFVRTHTNYEFYARKAIGFTNEEMLRQATVNGAKILGKENELGSVCAGKTADLIVIDGRPDEDISAMQQKPWAVIHNGICHK